MAEESPFEIIKAISDPAKVLIEKISNAIGGIFQPWQIRRVAEAEASADLLRAKTDIEITGLQIRAIERFYANEARKQQNIESITAKALPLIDDNSNPKNMEDDWIVNFFDKSKLISDEEMQILWSQILAGEANSPGAFSRRTVNFMSSLSKSEARRFKILCGYICNFSLVSDVSIPIIIDIQNDIYRSHDLYFYDLETLSSIGLIHFESIKPTSLLNLGQEVSISYFGKTLNILFEKKEKNSLEIGSVLLSNVGFELLSICKSGEIPGYFEYLREHYASKYNVTLSEIIT